MKPWIRAVPAALLALLLFGCGAGEDPSVAQPGKNPPQPAAAAEDSLSLLRRNMEPPVIAVATVGFPELTDDFDVMSYIAEEYPQWLEKQDFLNDIGEDRIIRTCGTGDFAQVVCIVPRDPDTQLRVSVMGFLDHSPYTREDVAYSSDRGDPIVLLADISDDVLVSVTATEPDGRGVTWQPYWGNTEAIPEGSYSGALVMDFTPMPEYDAVDTYREMGWYLPEAPALSSTLWESDMGYAMEFYYDPGQIFDGAANVYSIDANGNYETVYYGYWVIQEQLLKLDMVHITEDALLLQDSFPLLMEPGYGGQIWIGQNEAGEYLPFLGQGYAGCEFQKVGASAEGSSFDARRAEGWYPPELNQLMDRFWLSGLGYALELQDDSVPGDHTGWASVYDVGSIGDYTESYSGSWRYESGLLHLSLIPGSGDGYLIDESFPVLTDPWEEGLLFIGRSEYGAGLPHFPADLQCDTLEQPKG